jgi:Ca2+-binding RTX toxin-like protein
MPNILLTFDDLAAGDIVNGQYSSQGVTISSGDGSHPPMVFDTANPTGGDSDLATNNLGNVLILSEDGDSSDPDDDADGGKFVFDFAAPTEVINFNVLDNEEGGTVKCFDADGNLIKEIDLTTTSNNGQATIDVNCEGVASMEVYLCGSGAIDGLCYEAPVFGDPQSDAAGNGIVSGTAGDDLIDINYTGDPQGDMIDNGDAILPGQGPDDDIVLAGAGNDTVLSGLGDDTVLGGAGNDTVDGGVGDDVIFGDGILSVPTASDGSGPELRESFNWSELPDPTDGGQIDDNDNLAGANVSQDTGSVTVTFTETNNTGSSSRFDDREINVDDIDGGSETVNANSSLASGNSSANGTATYALDFSGSVTDVDFNVSDIDFDSQIVVRAYDADGNLIPVTISAGDDVILTDEDGVAGEETATSEGGNARPTNDDHTITVSIAGPVSRIEIDHNNDGGGDGSGVNISDVFFDVDPLTTITETSIGAGNDILDGGEGDDMIYGGGGDDTITGGDGSDYVQGGSGNDTIDTSGSGALPDIGYPGLFPGDSDPSNDIDTVYGGSGDDTISTGDDADFIDGGSGNDTIDGGLDADTILGGDGDDFIVGGEGSDTIDGGDGNDTIYAGLAPGYPDALNIPDATDLAPNNGLDVVHGGDGDDTIYGGDDNDTLYGDAGNDTIDGGIDDDTIFGGTGNDRIIGGEGEDTLSGGDDRDVFVGGNAGDTVDGGEGGDDYDVLDLTGSGPLRVTYDPLNSENGSVEYFDTDGNSTGTMTFENIENVIPCFTPGTLIATPKGERLVEELQEGDKIITRDNGNQEVRWVGHKLLDHATLARNEHLKPELIPAGSLGNGLPERDMLVSPNHRMLVANDKTSLYFEEREVLAAAKHLINNRGVHSMDTAGTTYIHFMFDQHEVVLGNGAWTESFQPGDQTLQGIGNAQRTEILELFPELKTVEGLEAYQSARKTLKKHEAKLLSL